jgi:signal transduction histidine kinase
MKNQDPVCGMLVSKDNDYPLSYKGRDYYFCSEKCKNLFEQEPELFISMMQSREDLIEKERIESLRRMADELTHEIRNPLTSIGGFARRIYKDLPEDAPYREYIKRVIDDVERLEKMINRLVQIETEDFNIEPSNINEIITEVVRSFEEDFRGGNRIIVTLDLKEIPLIPIDREKIKSVLSNLIINAIEAMERDPNVKTKIEVV